MTAGQGSAGDARGTGGEGDAGGGPGARSGGEYGGMDALMAAITGEPLPEEARRDPAFLARHRAAEADVAVLRDQLSRIAQALTGEPVEDVPGEPERGPAEQAEGALRPGEPVTHARPASAPRGGARPVRAGRRPPRPPRPGRPSGSRRALRVAFGALAGAGAFALVVGFGWMVTHSGGSEDSGTAAAAKSADKSAGDARADVSGDDGRPSDPVRALACSRLVVEGTVAKVEPRRQSPWSRITLKVIRSYKPAHGPARVSFLLDGGARPAPRAGQHVLVQVGAGRRNASVWAVGDTRVAVNRAWVIQALPASRHTTCPGTGEAPTGKP
ncbi:hypothetical protein [Streptomyces sp. NBC_00557]|uniref:hypothetical protein n=1 Tax=Streptomyces sp. NBC_00557 TaxID=2975776 RepID=UPI002E81C05E|nr:hypothetical protein [Streptomyces sp. NBC_00557]WUC36942.1 hypothetical protein OG956_23375 [Streptomyces sp. NBC_00557]